MDLWNPQIGDRMHTPSGAFEYAEEPPAPKHDRLDKACLFVAVIIALALALVAWKAIPKIAASIHEAKEISALYEGGY